MAILLALVTFLLIVAITALLRGDEPVEVLQARPAEFHELPKPRMVSELGFELPQGYFFHVGHTWALQETRDQTRVGLDAFAANLLGELKQINLPQVNRWVRQGQKLWSVRTDGITVEMLSPVEGLVVGVNPALEKDPELAIRDPYKDGWICVVKTPDLGLNEKNLLQGAMVAAFMRDSMTRVTRVIVQHAPALAQDGGVPVGGVLRQLAPEVRRRVITDIFLT